MGRGRMGVHKVVPPKGWRWAPKANAYAGCVGRFVKDGGSFYDGTQACKGGGSGGGGARQRR